MSETTKATEIRKSRLGRKPVEIKTGVKVALSGTTLKVEGPKGKLSQEIHPRVKVTVEEKEVLVDVTEADREARSLHGLFRSLVNNMVVGVSDGYEIKMEVIGVGYSADLKGNLLVLALGYSHTVDLEVPAIIDAKVDRITNDRYQVTLNSCDKQAIGQFAAEMKRGKPPEAYTGKGVRYLGEYVKIKPGKAFGSK